MVKSGSASERRWAFNLQGSKAVVRSELAPPGYVVDKRFDDNAEALESSGGAGGAGAGQRSMTDLVMKQAWAKSTSQMQPFFMNAFMMYMVGNQLNLWVILTVGYAVHRAVTGMFGVNAEFAKLPKVSVDMTVPKLAYFGTQCAQLALVLWKVGSMGLLPLTSADWVALIPLKQAVETSAPSISSIGM